MSEILFVSFCKSAVKNKPPSKDIVSEKIPVLQAVHATSWLSKTESQITSRDNVIEHLGETQKNLNDSKEILLILGENENSIQATNLEAAETDVCNKSKATDIFDTTEEILFMLNPVAGDKKSFVRIVNIQVSKSAINQDFESISNVNSEELIHTGR